MTAVNRKDQEPREPMQRRSLVQGRQIEMSTGENVHAAAEAAVVVRVYRALSVRENASGHD